MNKRDAVMKFAGSEFNNIPLSLVKKAYDYVINEKVVPLVEPTLNDYGLTSKYEPDEPDKEECTSEREYQNEMKIYKEELESFEEYTKAYEKWESDSLNNFPTWGTIFECKSKDDANRIRDNINEVQEMGFIILDDFDELDLCLGVDGGGYNFYEAHWSKLYDFLGMKWHDEEVEQVS